MMSSRPAEVIEAASTFDLYREPLKETANPLASGPTQDPRPAEIPYPSDAGRLHAVALQVARTSLPAEKPK